MIGCVIIGLKRRVNTALVSRAAASRAQGAVSKYAPTEALVIAPAAYASMDHALVA
jgi:hypothetical protein